MSKNDKPIEIDIPSVIGPASVWDASGTHTIVTANVGIFLCPNCDKTHFNIVCEDIGLQIEMRWPQDAALRMGRTIIDPPCAVFKK